LSARHIRDARRGIRKQALMELRHRREPLLPEQVLEQWSRKCRLALVHVLAVGGVGHAFPGSECVNQRVDRLYRGENSTCDRRDVVERA
jgi:hypothetical protein